MDGCTAMQMNMILNSTTTTGALMTNMTYWAQKTQAETGWGGWTSVDAFCQFLIDCSDS